MSVSSGGRPTRRTVLAFGVGTALAVGAGSAVAAPVDAGPRAQAPGRSGIVRHLRELERKHDARLGVFARNTVTGETVRYRADEPFPMCSVFKTLAAAAVLRDLDHDGTFLARVVRYTADDVEKAGHSPVTGDAGNLAHGMTVAALCSATISYSDNTAANLLLRELGGPAAVTRFCRSTGDRTTRLDRWEPELNTAEPGRETDTTTPAAIGRTYEGLVLGNLLAPGDRDLLTGWMLANTTSTERFRKGLPAGWALADKTGGGQYGTNNDVGIAWTEDRTPVVLSVLTTKRQRDAPGDHPLIARTAALLAAELA
ncbi:class A beta-lactamase [Streptomyces sp. NPDC051567]|uniref:class A beta-lactamase n=1 Tax=Streptomyces sp. NPDC051567 TaxID=3365660 RepID=UPI0037B5A52B